MIQFSTSRLTSVIGVAVVSTLSASANDLIITEYIEGSSNNKAIEVTNVGNVALDLSAASLNVYFNGSQNVGAAISLSSTLSPGESYVVAHSSANSEILSKADQTYGGGLFNGDDAVTLTFNDVIVDSIGRIGEDPGNQWGSAPASTQNATLRRRADQLEGRSDAYATFLPESYWEGFPKDDASDLGQFEWGSNPPGNTQLGLCGDSAVTINTIQGFGDVSPLNNEWVTVEAVVTADFSSTDQLNGIFIQQEVSEFDEHIETSEGIFVYLGNYELSVVPGQRVRLHGQVSESYGQTQIDSIKEHKVCDTDITISPQVVNTSDGLMPNMEPYEGMLVTFNEALTVTDHYNLVRYGELLLSGRGVLMNPTQVATPGEAAQAIAEQNAKFTIILDDASTQQNPGYVPYPAPEFSADNPIRIGDRVHGVTGVVGFAYGAYRVQPTQTLTFEAVNLRQPEPELVRADHLTIASFNVLNFFNGDGQGGGFPSSRGADSLVEFERQQSKIIEALVNIDADVVGLVELENDGYGNLSAVADLTRRLNDRLGSDVYDFVDPNLSAIGNDVITVGVIYKPGKVTQAGSAVTLGSYPFDDKNRQPLAVTFSDNTSNEVFTVAINHFKSKGSCPNDGSTNDDQLDGQGCWNSIRTEASLALANWLGSNPTGVATEHKVILGDLNAYAKEDPIESLREFGFIDLAEAFASPNSIENSYSYRFKGELGTLDYALVSASLRPYVQDMSIWHINADEVQQLDYNLEYKNAIQQESYYRADAYRSSDHDPVIFSLRFNEPNQPPVAAMSTYRFGLFSLLVNHSYDLDGDITSWEWLFSDGKRSQQNYLWRWFWQLKGEQVVLTVTDDKGATDTIRSIL